MRHLEKIMLDANIALLFHLLIVLTGSSTGSGFRSLTSCNCLGQISSFECTAVGGSFTVWDGSAFMCAGEEISLPHFGFLTAVGSCNNEAIIARGVQTNNTMFTSRLEVSLSAELVGRSIFCKVDYSNQTAPVTIGGETLTMTTTNTILPPSNICVEYHGPQELVFSWSDESHDDCSSFFYNISTTNCGTCTPSTTTSNTSTCTDLNSILQSTTNNICNFTVKSVICGNIPGNVMSFLLFLKVPDGVNVKSIPYYGAKDELTQLKTTFNVLDLSQESLNDSFYSMLNASTIWYNIIYADSTSGRICHPDSIMVINASACEGGMCQHTFDISSSLCPSVTNITVTVFATNIFGDGHNSTPITISGVNKFVDVTFDVQTMTVSCHFLNTFITGNKICIANISNNESCAESVQSFRGEDIGNPVTTTPLQFSDGVSEICLIVTAISGNKTVIKQKSLNIIIRNQPGLIENNVTPIIVPVISTLILLVIIGIVTVITAVILYVQCCQTKVRIKAHEMYFKERSKDIQNLKSAGSNPYPHVFTLTHTLNKFVSEYQNLQPGQRKESESVSLAGRIFTTRIHGQSLFFFDMYGDDSKVQVKVDRKNYSGNTFEVHRNIKRGDIIGVNGFPERTNKGELSIVSTSTQILAPCLHPLPKLNSLEDKELRYRQRHLDLMINEEVRKKFKTRAKILKLLRKFLNKKGFVEVETPVMDYIFGGAAAKPFKTYHKELDQELYLRIAPELHLKRLVIGGLNRVYEIGRQFRNEGIDSTHSPEFTSCEFYMAYTDYNGLMEMTEELLSGLVEKVKGNTKFVYHKVKHSKKTEVEIDFKTPFQKIRIIPTLQEKLKVKFPPSSEFAKEEFKRFLDDICLDKGVECKEPRTAARLLDKLIEEFIQKDCINPTFIMDHPQILCPLAKWHRDDKGLTERFELIVCQEEICNAYTELNDPELQREFFQQQDEVGNADDNEAHVVDDNYCEALEYGLPPTAGWGMGIDRLTMFLTDSSNIKEVLLFPLLKPKNQPKPQFQAVEAEAEAVEAEAVEAEAVKPHTEPVVKPPNVKPDTVLAIEPEITPAVKPPDAEPAAVKPDTVPAVKPDTVPTDEFESVL